MPPRRPAAAGDTCGEVGSYVASWRLAAASGDGTRFARRLAHLHLDHLPLDDLEDALRAPDLHDPPARWIIALSDIAELASEFLHAEVPSSARPLADLLAPLRQYAGDRLAPVAKSGCLGLLERRLETLMSPVVDAEFRRYKAAVPAGDWVDWVRRLHQQGLLPIWEAYPALARLVGTLVVNVVDRVHELLDRIAGDRPALMDRCDGEGFSLTAVTPLGGDLHAGHAFVCSCAFRTDSGRDVLLVYKPRPCDGERLLHDTTARLAETGTPIGVSPWTLACGDHGWMDYVASAPADSAEDARQFFRQAGALAAVVYRTGGHDFHAENVVAVGGVCIGVDAETLLAPIVADEDGLTTTETRSVIDAMIVPRWVRLRGVPVEMTALGCRSTAATPHGAVLQWVRAGTSEAGVEVRREPSLAPLSPARSSAGVYWAAQDFADEILDGFTRAWDALDGMDWSGGGVARIDEMGVRVLMRMTSTYGRVLQTSLEPALLRDGLARSIHLEHLCRPLLEGIDRPGALALADEEIRFLEQGTLPAFYTRADSGDMRTSRGELIASFDTSAADHFRRRLAASDRDRDRQLRLIRTSLAVAVPGVRRVLLEQEGRETGSADDAASVGVRDALGALTERYRLRDARADPNGPGLTTIDATQWGIEPWSAGFYDGTAGIAAWMFALAGALDDGEIADRAESILTAGLDRIVIDPNRAVRRHGLSGQDGISGMFVGWSACLTMSPRPATRERIVDTSRALMRAMVEEGVPPLAGADLLSGCTGLLAGLLAVDRLGVQVPASLRAFAMNSVANDPSDDCGYSHGKSGRIGLLAVAAARGWLDHDEVIVRLVEEESAQFDPQARNWPRARAEAGSEIRTGWCNGFSGVALARSMVRGNTALSSPAIPLDITRSLSGISATGAHTDNLCCGLAGRAEILRHLRRDPAVSGARALHDAAIAELAERAVANRLRLAFPAESPIPPYGLFQGIGGVIYALASRVAQVPHLVGWAPEN